MPFNFRKLFLLVVTGLLPLSLFAGADSPFNGRWEVIRSMSPNVNRYSRTLELNVSIDGEEMTMVSTWGRRRERVDVLEIKLDGQPNRVSINHRTALSTIYSAIHQKPGDVRTVSATIQDNRTLQMVHRYPVEISQGSATLLETHVMRVSGNGLFLTYTIDRDSRPDQPTAKYVFKRKGSLQAHFMELEDNWEVKGGLQRQALLISLQGLVNRDTAKLYFIYPETWQFTYTRRLHEWYRDERGYSFTRLGTTADALTEFRDQIKGYVVWDKDVRTSLIVAYTVAGLEDAVVATGDQVDVLDSLGFSKVEDFRGRFTGMSDAEIYGWAKEEYWHRCSRKFLIWLGGDAGRIMKPGVADWGVANRVFFQDLSADPRHEEEYNMARELLGDMQSDALIMGWHSYGKDRESQHVTLCSSFGLPVLGLHSNPNISFQHHIGFSEGFEFKNNHNTEPGITYEPEEKVYMACIQTDGIGIGAWLKPGRGEIPYAWETLMNYSWLAPSLLEFFYSTATPNDYFIGALSGPGYMYPKAVPKEKLSILLRRAETLMKQLDLHVFDIMDYSTHGPEDEFADLTLSVIEAYYENMPNAIGFVNGYVPANTYFHKDGRPMISFEYYLSPIVSEDEAVADLIELAELNANRPYYLLLHIRESSDISRVKSILDQLPDEFEIVPLDLFLKMAGNTPTFVNRYIDR